MYRKNTGFQKQQTRNGFISLIDKNVLTFILGVTFGLVLSLLIAIACLWIL